MKLTSAVWTSGCSAAGIGAGRRLLRSRDKRMTNLLIQLELILKALGADPTALRPMVGPRHQNGG